MFITALRQQKRLHLPELHTLRLRAVNAIAIRQLCFWSAPMLDHLILDDAPSDAEMLDTLWETFGDQLLLCPHRPPSIACRLLTSRCVFFSAA